MGDQTLAERKRKRFQGFSAAHLEKMSRIMRAARERGKSDVMKQRDDWRRTSIETRVGS